VEIFGIKLHLFRLGYHWSVTLAAAFAFFRFACQRGVAVGHGLGRHRGCSIWFATRMRQPWRSGLSQLG